MAAAAGTSAALQQAGSASGAAAGLDGPVMLSSSDLEWGGEDGGAGVDQVSELQCRTRGLPDEDTLGPLPSSALSLGVSSTTFASLAFAGEGSSLARGTTIASGIGPIAGPSVSASTSASAVGSQQRPALSRFKDEELNCPICEWTRAALLGALYCLAARGTHGKCAGSHTWQCQHAHGCLTELLTCRTAPVRCPAAGLELLFKPVGLACGHKVSARPLAGHPRWWLCRAPVCCCRGASHLASSDTRAFCWHAW